MLLITTYGVLLSYPIVVLYFGVRLGLKSVFKCFLCVIITVISIVILKEVFTEFLLNITTSTTLVLVSRVVIEDVLRLLLLICTFHVFYSGSLILFCFFHACLISLVENYYQYYGYISSELLEYEVGVITAMPASLFFFAIMCILKICFHGLILTVQARSYYDRSYYYFIVALSLHIANNLLMDFVWGLEASFESQSFLMLFSHVVINLLLFFLLMLVLNRTEERLCKRAYDES